MTARVYVFVRVGVFLRLLVCLLACSQASGSRGCCCFGHLR